MGLFSFITDIFSKPKKGKPKKKKKVAKKKTTAKKGKKKAASKDELDIATSKKKPAKGKKKPAKKKSSSILPFKLDAKKSKKRKKTKKISADPIDEQALGFNISLKGDAEQAKKRDAMRITVKGLKVFVPRLNKSFPVTDISATGLGFKFEKPRMKGGVKLNMNIVLKGETKVEGITAKVMRHDRGSVGCVFIDLDRHQDDTVHEIVLLGQKEQTARRAAKKDADFKLPK